MGGVGRVGEEWGYLLGVSECWAGKGLVGVEYSCGVILS